MDNESLNAFLYFTKLLISGFLNDKLLSYNKKFFNILFAIFFDVRP